MATDPELNQYLSVKKFAPYRTERRWDKTRGERLRELKVALGKRVAEGDGGWAEGERAEVGEGTGVKRKGKKRKGRKERMKMKA